MSEALTNRMLALSNHLYHFEDTCNVYVIRSEDSATLIDFGSGDVLDHLEQIGVHRVTDVLITHHHRDQCQGLQRAVDLGIRIWVPHTEQELFTNAGTHWQSREIYNNYNMRQDRFSLLESVPIDGTLKDYETRQFGEISLTVIPTPGHTIGSISLLTTVDDIRAAFTGDLIAAPGQVWSLSATQWTYNGAEGTAASILSLLDMKERQPDLLLPSHGMPMSQPDRPIDLLVERLWRLLRLREQNTRLFELRQQPYETITPHLLRSRVSVATSYVLISDSRKALVIDFGYDFVVGMPSGSDRASRRPWLYTIPMLKRDYGIEQIEIVIPTHFHDDHVAGINLLRRVENTQVWAAATFANILENPARYDLPCLWYDPIAVDRQLMLETPIQWEEYTFTLHPLPGHTRHAVAVEFEVDGYRVLAAGDQYQGGSGLELNYVYANQFDAADYIKSAELYRRIEPGIILSGHWEPLWVTPGYFDKLAIIGQELARLHEELLPQSPDLGSAGFLARITPYQAAARPEEQIDYQVEIHNPFEHPAEALVQVVTPAGWQVAHAAAAGQTVSSTPAKALSLQLREQVTYLDLQLVAPPDFAARRARIAVDLTIDGRRFGQQAEALVTAPRQDETQTHG